MPDMDRLYRINDALTALAHELGVEVTEQWEDDVLNDLTHTVGAAMGVPEAEPSVPPATKPFTVIGFWDAGDRRHVIGVIEGEHDVMGGESPGEGGLFADYVEAETWEEAEEKTHGTREEDDDEDEEEG